jgi:lambda repressor-like predicted transcriptional regulator
LVAPAVAASSQLDARVGISLLYLVVIPAFVPSTLAAYSVVGEREQGTLAPVLITPIRREEFLVGKALAVFANPVVPLRHTHAVADLPDVISRSEPRGLAQTRPPPRSVKVKN